MLPREHGAYGQLVFPLVTALAIAGLTPSALLTSVATVAGFLVHEPLLVLLGRRGPRARREMRGRALAWCVSAAAVGVASGLAAVWLTPPAWRWSFLVPLVPAAVLAVALAANREKSAVGELAAATAFSCVAIPVCVSSGVPVSVALSIAVAFAVLFSAATLGVRVVILRVRGGGDVRAARATARLLGIVVIVAVGAITAAAARGMLPWATLAAVSPGLIAGVALTVRPPAPTHLRVVGWTLIGASAAAALILIAGSRLAA